MKTGLILAYKGTNYGMLLQAYATQAYLDAQGVDTEIITVHSKSSPRNLMKKLFRYLSPTVLRESLRKKKRKHLVKKDSQLFAAYQKRVRVGADFVQSKLHDIQRFNGYAAAGEHAKNHYACVMIGSDQQWAPACFYNKLNTMQFVPDEVKKASYATSMGVSTIPKSTYKALKSFIARMDHIAVREKTGAKIISSVTGRTDVRVVPDPTFLLTREDWERSIPDKKPEEFPYVFCYFLGNSEDSLKQVNAWAREKNLRVIAVRNIESYTKKKINYEDATVLDGPTVDEFVNYIRHAELVCTDSFHCTVFSIINNTDFATFYRTNSNHKNSRNSRIDDLLSTYGLTNRICCESRSMAQVTAQPIDYEKVNQTIQTVRTVGIEYLREVLSE